MRCIIIISFSDNLLHVGATNSIATRYETLLYPMLAQVPVRDTVMGMPIMAQSHTSTNLIMAAGT